MTNAVAGSFPEWRDEARRLLRARVPPGDVLWSGRGDTQGQLLLGNDIDDVSPAAAAPAVRVPRRFFELARLVACHRDAGRWDALYHVLWRLTNERKDLLDVSSDPDVHRVEGMAAQVRRDDHKMRAFVRFSKTTDADGERFVAWYRPDHLIVPLAAPFFADRFSSMRWSILTPDVSVHWDLRQLSYTAGVEQPGDVSDAAIETLWRTYYGAVFNPARLNLAATLREMPLRRWGQLPEARDIPRLVHSAHERASRMVGSATAVSAREFLPAAHDLDSLRKAANACRGCELHARATRVVFGAGPGAARLVLVGEQPGHEEDLAGAPFVGPAGQVLDRALRAAGINRSGIYVTNAVKHFSFEERGKRRIHQTPRVSHIRACRPWLEAEIQALRPRCVVCLGSTAASSLLGPQTRVMSSRGRVIEGTAWAPAVIVTVHPSAVLRADDGEGYLEMLVADLRLAAEASLRNPES